MALSFLKTGAESAKLAQKAAQEAQQRKEEQGKLWRFFLANNEEARITFVDGDLSKEGYLLPPRYYEHNLQLNGKWGNTYVCPEKTEPDKGDKCPICESGDRPSLVALFTVIDHREFTVQKGPNAGKVYKNRKKLLVCKPQTFEILNKHAIKRGGLARATFDVSRIGDKSASVGSMFEFVEKKELAELQKLYMIEKTDPKTNVKTKVTDFVPANYEEEITAYTGDELRVKLGGTSQPQMETAAVSEQDQANYADQL